MVYVVSQEGKPLMPTKRHGKVKHLLRSGMAKVVCREPFTIQLNYTSSEYTQQITLGVDAGSKTIGLSASTETEELYAAEVLLRTDVVDLLSARRAFRRARRSRTTRYRAPRFDNRKKLDDWLAPSIRQKIQTHHKAVALVYKILPVSKIVVEVAAFDIQKIRNPEVSGVGYQQGEQADFWNVREYVLWRDNHTCQHCKGKCRDKILNVHHIESRTIGGDAPNNLITLCETCHKKHHAGEIVLKAKRGISFRDAAFMGIMRWSFFNKIKEQYSNVNLTYGYLTKMTRIAHGLTKGHCTDAFCIAKNMDATMLSTSNRYLQKAVRRHNRQIHKATIAKCGKRQLNQAPKVIHGFKLFDKVSYRKQNCFVFGRRSSGYFDLRRLDGTKIHASANVREIKRVVSAKTFLTEALGGSASSPA